MELSREIFLNAEAVFWHLLPHSPPAPPSFRHHEGFTVSCAPREESLEKHVRYAGRNPPVMLPAGLTERKSTLGRIHKWLKLQQLRMSSCLVS